MIDNKLLQRHLNPMAGLLSTGEASGKVTGSKATSDNAQKPKSGSKSAAKGGFAVWRNIW